eukprot:10659691-Heterocapsa_arctica.AAC.1
MHQRCSPLNLTLPYPNCPTSTADPHGSLTLILAIASAARCPQGEHDVGLLAGEALGRCERVVE